MATISKFLFQVLALWSNDYLNLKAKSAAI